MLNQLVNHNDDIRRLVEKGYAMALDGNNYLVVREIPYLDDKRALQIGAFVTSFVDKGQDRIAQHSHEIFFAGSVPHGLDGKPIPNLGGGPTQLTLSEASQDVVVQRSFSNKLMTAGQKRDYEDFFEKIENYVALICSPAIELHHANPLTFRARLHEATSFSPFKFRDTLTSLAEIGDLAANFKDDVIAVFGIGGTGGYLLDFMVKSPVREIRAFDLDVYHVHNAFRSPGKLESAELDKSKAEVYQSRYDNFRTGLTVTRKFIDASCSDDLNGVTFAFVCVDKGSSRAGIFDLLLSKKIPFIDVGMGLDRNTGPLDGAIRVTYYSADNGQQVWDKNLAPLTDSPDNVYRTNIQIAELNALNACLAVIRFKQLRGYYVEKLPIYHLLFDIEDFQITPNAEGE